MAAGSEPPLLDALKSLYHQIGHKNIHECSESSVHTSEINNDSRTIEDCKLPLIDLNRLSLSFTEQEICKQEIANAAATYGFFHIINHGMPKGVLERLYHQQMTLFRQSFHIKSGNMFMNLPANSYRWGNPAAKSVGQFMWSEAFHIGASDISNVDACNRSSFETFASGAVNLSKRIAEILAENLGVSSCTSLFNEKCSSDSCYLRLNRYPPCHISSEVFGIMPHTDSGFLTILLQDEVGGLQLVKHGRWYNVQPVSGALTVSIGDLFEAWSNRAYKSVRHRVVAHAEKERLSLAYFYCPSYETVIEPCMSISEHQEPQIHRKFSFGEYRKQVQLDVQSSGDKIGLSRFYKCD
ncbi:hypothetical protein QQ045_031137 [Rhodiola kirilowii]